MQLAAQRISSKHRGLVSSTGFVPLATHIADEEMLLLEFTKPLFEVHAHNPRVRDEFLALNYIYIRQCRCLPTTPMSYIYRERAIYTCMCVRVCVCVCFCVCVCVHACMHTHTHTYMHTYMHACMYIFASAAACSPLLRHTHTRTYARTHAHTHTHTHTPGHQCTRRT